MNNKTDTLTSKDGVEAAFNRAVKVLGELFAGKQSIREVAPQTVGCERYRLTFSGARFSEANVAMADLGIAIRRAHAPETRSTRAILPKLEYAEYCGCCQRNKITIDVFAREKAEGPLIGPAQETPATLPTDMRKRMLEDEELSEEEFQVRAHRIALEAHEDRLKLWEGVHSRAGADPDTGDVARDAARYRFMRQSESVLAPEHDKEFAEMWADIYQKNTSEFMDRRIDRTMNALKAAPTSASYTLEQYLNNTVPLDSRVWIEYLELVRRAEVNGEGGL